MKEQEQETLTYSESIKVNIGDFESRDYFLSYKVVIGENETFDAAFKRAKTKVRKKMLKEDKITRTQTKEFVDFDTKAKIRK